MFYSKNKHAKFLKYNMDFFLMLKMEYGLHIGNLRIVPTIKKS